jgi:hypothetical protein
MDAAFRALLDAIGTDCFFTNLASRGASDADGFIAASTAGGAFFAKIVVAVVAVVAVFPVHYVPAFIAGITLPFIQRNVRAVRAIGIQDSFHQHEEIAQPALFQGCLYGGRTLALAEHVVAHVRMGHVFVRRRRIRVKGYAVVGIAFVKLGQPFQLKQTLERTKIKAIQRNRPRYGGDGFSFFVELHRAELAP